MLARELTKRHETLLSGHFELGVQLNVFRKLGRPKLGLPHAGISMCGGFRSLEMAILARTGCCVKKSELIPERLSFVVVGMS